MIFKFSCAAERRQLAEVRSSRFVRLWFMNSLRSGLLGRIDFKVRVKTFGNVHEESNRAFGGSFPQAADHQAGFLGAIDKDLDPLIRHLDAGVKPRIRIRNGMDRFLELPGLLFSELVPGVLWPRDVLDCPLLERFVRLEIEGAEVDCLKCFLVGDVESKA